MASFVSCADCGARAKLDRGLSDAVRLPEGWDISNGHTRCPDCLTPGNVEMVPTQRSAATRCVLDTIMELRGTPHDLLQGLPAEGASQRIATLKTRINDYLDAVSLAGPLRLLLQEVLVGSDWQRIADWVTRHGFEPTPPPARPSGDPFVLEDI